jgi:hypothetical protein
LLTGCSDVEQPVEFIELNQLVFSIIAQFLLCFLNASVLA